MGRPVSAAPSRRVADARVTEWTAKTSPPSPDDGDTLPALAPLDAGAALYRDRSGPPRGKMLSEGRDNFGAITAEARRSVEVPQKRGAS